MNVFDLATKSELIKLFAGWVESDNLEQINDNLSYAKDKLKNSDEDANKKAVVNLYMLRGNKEKAVKIFKTIKDQDILNFLARGLIYTFGDDVFKEPEENNVIIKNFDESKVNRDEGGQFSEL